MSNGKKSQGHSGHTKDKCELGQALVMINLYAKFNVHSSYAKQVIVLIVADRWTDGRTDTPGDNNRHPPNFWLRFKSVLTACSCRLTLILVLLGPYTESGKRPVSP